MFTALNKLDTNLQNRILRNICISSEHTYNHTPCWEWTAGRTATGYGQFRIAGFSGRRAHRLIFQALYGRLAQTTTCDHLCRNIICVNPKHLEAVSIRTNVLRSTSFVAINAAKTHCPRGHTYTGLNGQGRRICKLCNAATMRRFRQRMIMAF